MTATPLRLATFNLENLGDASQGEAVVRDRLNVLRPQLIRTRADVLCLQEVDGQRLEEGSKKRGLPILERLLEGTPFADFQRTQTVSASRGGGVRDKHNLVILSRFPILEAGQVRHDFVDAPLYRRQTARPAREQAEAVDWDRGFIWARVDLGGRALTVANLHLRAPRAAWVEGQKADSRTWKTVPGWAEGFFLAAVKRAGQALEVRMFIDSVMDDDPGALVAVCGDFNADVHETPVRTIRGDEEDTGNGHLATRMLVPVERSLSQSQRFSVIHHGRPQMLDHILVSQSLLAWYRHSEIHNEALGDELSSPAVVRGAPASYHAPVVAEFELADTGHG